MANVCHRAVGEVLPSRAGERAPPEGDIGVTTAFFLEDFCSHGGVLQVWFGMKARCLAVVLRGDASC